MTSYYPSSTFGVGLPIRVAGSVYSELPLNERGELDTSVLGKQFGESAFPVTNKEKKEEEEKPETKEDTETDTTNTDASADTSAEGSDSSGKGPLFDQKPDIPYGGLMDVVEGLLDRQATIRDRELAAEMQRYVLQGALRQQGLKELSRRAIEQKNIEAWSNLQVARQYAQAQQATALATTAYLAGIPNYNVMQAMNEGMKAGMQNIQLQAPPPPQPRSYFRGVG